MRKCSFIVIALFFSFLCQLSAKTIWIKDLTNNHPSMIKFYSAIIDDLKLTKYADDLQTVNDNKEIHSEIGDIVLEFNGNGVNSNTGNITYFNWVGCTVDNCNNWAYRGGSCCLFSDEYIFEDSRKVRNEIVKFLDKWY